MSQLFSLDAQRCGAERRVHADADGFGLTVYTDGTPVRARSVNDAIRVARDYIGEFLQPAERGEIPWGLRVGVSDGNAAYGEWPLAGRRGGDEFENSPLVRIRRRWHDSGPLSALANAIEIIRAYAPGAASRRAA